MTQLPIYTGPAFNSETAAAAAIEKDVDADSLADFATGEFIKKTKSLCPVCLKKIDASVYERDDAVYMDKECAEHGRYSALLASERRHYYVVDPDVESLACCCGPTQHCGDQVENHSCNMLLEICLLYTSPSPRD